MSTKTLRKRIALVAVSAMGFGLLTSVSANAAISAATGGFGSTDVTILSGKVTAVADVSGSTTAMTAAITSDGAVQIALTAGTASQARAVVTNGYISSVTQGGTAVASEAPSYFTHGATATVIVVKANAGATSMVVNSYATTAARTAGTAANTITISIVASGTVGTFSYSDSAASVYASGTSTTPSDYVDGVPAALKVAVGTSASRINYSVKDVNANAISSALVQATSSSTGCVLSSDGSTFTGTSSAQSGATGSFYIARTVAQTPATCTISLTVNGAAWTTKTITFQGKVAKVEVIDGQAGISNAKASGTASADVFYYQALDAAGNALHGITVANVPTATGSYTSLDTSATTVTTAGSLPAAASVTCSTTKGSFDFYLKVVNEANEVIKSPVYKINCFGTPVNYTATLDKSSYVPGDIATLTITAKDSAGNPGNDYIYLGGAAADGTGTTNPVSISGSNLTAVTAPTSTDMFVGGVKKYKFVVGSTEGSYQLVVDLPKFNSTTYNQAAVNVAYTIKASSASVSNAEVLAAIVKLIASINKQIAALQKALTKKK